MLANMNGLAAPSPTAVGPPPSSRTVPSVAFGAPPPADVHECSTSPTNTSASDVSGLSSSDLAAIILAGQQNITVKQDFPETLVKRELPPMANPLFGVSDAAALLQFLQAQQAVAQEVSSLQFHAQAQAAAQQRAALHQQQQHQTTPPERKRFAVEDVQCKVAPLLVRLQALNSRQSAEGIANSMNPLSILPQMVNNNNKMTSNTLDGKIGRTDSKAIKLENADSLDNGVSSSGSAEDLRSKIVGGRSLSNFVLSMRPQTSRPGESVQPRYLKTIPSATVLDDEQVKDTIFEAVPTALTAEVVEYVRDQIEDDTALLSEEQHQRVTDILRKVNLKKFEIEFSIHSWELTWRWHEAFRAWFSVGRLDMTVLPLDRASLVLEAVPSAADVERIRRFTAAHPNSQWTEAEQFVIDLAAIERAEEKLTVMVHTATFDDGINAINEVCSAQLADGSSVLQTLTAFIRDRAPYASDAAELVEPLSEAAKVSFLSIYESLLRLDENNQRVQVELEQLDFEHPVLALRLSEMRQRLEEMADKLVRVKDQVLLMLAYMGEALPRTESDFRPELYLQKLCSFIMSLRLRQIEDVEVEN
uniref:ANK_REP_REGION domain-containing protein n=1 Tax=Angiostrongylus cantonensis TaxID=6313 RepID=A0A158P8B4_ANGCA